MKYLTIILLLILSKHVLAQNKSIQPLQKMVQKMSKATSVQFDEFVKEKSIFSNDTSQRHTVNKIFFNIKGEIISSDIIVKSIMAYSDDLEQMLIEIIDQSSAGLWEGQIDEDELGMTYSQIDTFILTGTFQEMKMSIS